MNFHLVKGPEPGDFSETGCKGKYFFYSCKIICKNFEKSSMTPDEGRAGMVPTGLFSAGGTIPGARGGQEKARSEQDAGYFTVHQRPTVEALTDSSYIASQMVEGR